MAATKSKHYIPDQLYILIAQEFVCVELNFMDIQLKAQHKIVYLEQINMLGSKKVCTSEIKHYGHTTKCWKINMWNKSCITVD